VRDGPFFFEGLKAFEREPVNPDVRELEDRQPGIEPVRGYWQDRFVIDDLSYPVGRREIDDRSRWRKMRDGARYRWLGIQGRLSLAWKALKGVELVEYDEYDD
jgi:hypothetical protein